MVFFIFFFFIFTFLNELARKRIDEEFDTHPKKLENSSVSNSKIRTFPSKTFCMEFNRFRIDHPRSSVQPERSFPKDIQQTTH